MGRPSADVAAGSTNVVVAPALPEGGGAIRSIGESFATNPATGTASFTVALPVSPGRSGFNPDLSLSYESGNGNGPFGLGWSLNLPTISRRLDRRVPTYGPNDVFILTGQDDLVPVLEPNGSGGWRHDSKARGEFDVDRYRPRVEGMFGRIERWVRRSDGDIHWRTISRDNVSTVFGRTPQSRIADPADPARIVSWLASESYDSHGNAMAYEYVAEDSTNVAPGAHEAHRGDRARAANRYLSRVRYGNRNPGIDDPDWMFSLVFDYGEHVVRDLPEVDGRQFVAVDEAVQARPARLDPFSTYRAGFEVRTYRLCRRILMVHHFPDELGRDDCLTRSMLFAYDENPTASRLIRITQCGHVARPIAGEPERYLTRALPAVEFGYSPIPDADTIARQPLETIDEPALTDPATVWVDLDGIGATGLLTEIDGAVFYRRNTSPVMQTARFAPPTVLEDRPARPIGEGGQFIDLDGDGVADLVHLDRSASGFYRRTSGGWSDFEPFGSLPTIDLEDRRLSWIDLDGDGLSDLLLADDGLFTWYPSRGPDGFGPAVRQFRATDESSGPHLVFGDEVQSVFVADLSGDGLSDLVRIRNGDVCYWPNLGHGGFGAKVTMDDAPVLDHPDLFDPARIQLADIDGSGTTDIVYAGSGGIVVHLNRSGNSWSAAVAVPQAAGAERPGDVRVTDLLGTGTACVVITSPGPEPIVRYVDLMGGRKPHLLTRRTNGLGVETTLDYAPSTRFAVADAEAGRPWATTLPFPVHLVERVTTRDLVSDNVFTTSYTYHHGYFDGPEREFRGFAMVERFDTEEFTSGANTGEATRVPPTVTRTWFHTGIALDLGHEYYHDADAPPLPDSVVPAGLSEDENRQACRALKTAMLREEVYARDGSAIQDRPYVVTEHNHGIVRLQPGVFFRQPRETISYAYDRTATDPRVSHDLTLDVDPPSGLVRKQVTISYGRRIEAPNLDLADRNVQAQTFLTWTEHRYADALDQPDDHRSGMVAETTLWELSGYQPESGGTRFSFTEFTAGDYHAFTDAEVIAAEDTPDATVRQRRVVQQSRTLYRTEDLTGLAALGTCGPRAPAGPTYRLALTPGLVASTYTRDNPLLPQPGPLLENRGEDGGGYIAIDGAWWIPGEQVFYDPAVNPDQPATTAAQELVAAEGHFFLPRLSADPFGASTVVEHDPHDLFVIREVDALGNVVAVAHDYRVLEPVEVTDPNGNRVAVLHDALGLVVARSMTGKVDDDIGDWLDGIDADPAPATIQALLVQPPDHASALLGAATQRFVYDVDRFTTAGEPTVAVTLSRELHLHQENGTPSPVQIRLAFTDGFGREIQVKVRAEPDAHNATRWVGTGRIVLNNKGKPVRRYDPFFSSTHLFEPEAGFTGVSSELFYDPVERVVATIRPDRSYEKVVYSPWEQTTYDVNDTVTADPRTDPDVAGVVAGFFAAQDPGWTTWYEQRIGNQLGPAEHDAAVKAQAHANTPSHAHLDPMGRPFLTIGENRFTVDGALVEQRHRTKVVFDIRGNQLAVLDGAGRLVMTYAYDLDGRRLHQAGLDSGKVWLLNDAGGRTIRSWDSRRLDRRLTYDELRRPTGLHLTENGQERQAEKIVYGESPDDNLILQVHQLYDSAGVLTQARYDFAGNAVDTRRDLLTDYDNPVDWATDPAADDGTFRIQRSYDALNRPLAVESPDASVYLPTFNEAGLLETVGVRLRGASASTPFVTGIEYDERGERLRVDYGNGAGTVYGYDPLTRRLASARTTRPTRSDPTASQLFADPHVVQDLRYTYDPAGNVTRIEDAALPVIVHAGLVVEPVRTFGYDAAYRVIEATGRDHIAQTQMAAAGARDRPFAGGHPNDVQAMRTYTERYEYDDTGNLTRLRHRSGSNGWNRRYDYAGTTNRVARTTIANGTTTAEDYDYADAQGDDADGCITAINGLVLGWDYKHRLVSADLGGGGTAHMGYDAADQRVRKVVESSPGVRRTERIWFEGFEIRRDYTGGVLSGQRETLHVPAGDRTVAIVETLTTDGGTTLADPDPLSRYQLTDHLGSSSAELDGNGDLIALEEYHPFGTTSFQAGRTATEVNLRRYRYTGRERDEETGLYYLGARYYAPWLGRWCSPDPLGLIDSPNTYLYARNNPLVHTDTPGTEPKRVVRTDNYRELLRDAIAEVEHVSVTDEALQRRFAHYASNKSVGPVLRVGGPDAVESAFQEKVMLSGRVTTKLDGFSPPGWRPGPADQCGTLAREGAGLTMAPGESVSGGGGIVLYEAEKQRFKTDKTASDVALAQIRKHIDSGRALMAGVSEPGHGHVVDPKKQPVTDHFVDIYGYETDSTGQIVALLAKDNAVSAVGEVRFTAAGDGSITKPVEPTRPEEDKYMRQEYQLSEVKFHTGFEYTGAQRPKNDAGTVMFWPVPPAPKKK